MDREVGELGEEEMWWMLEISLWGRVRSRVEDLWRGEGRGVWMCR